MLLGWTYSGMALCVALGLALGITGALIGKLVANRKTKARGLGLAACCLAVFAVAGYFVFEYLRPYDLQIRDATFSTILSASPGRAIVIENHDARSVIVHSVIVNGDLPLTKLMTSIPRGKEAQFPIKVLPGETLELMVYNATVDVKRFIPSTRIEGRRSQKTSPLCSFGTSGFSVFK